MPIKNIIWDWNGTLINDLPLAINIINTMLSKRGMTQITIDHYKEIYQHPVSKVYEKIGFDLAKEPFEELSHEWHGDYLKGILNVPLFEDTKEILQFCKSKNINQTILTALPHDILIGCLRHHEIEDFFSYYKGLDDRYAKSKIDNGHELMKKLDLNPQKTIIIGDSKHDVETAEALGVNCILVSRGFESKERLTQHGYQITDNLINLFSILDSGNAGLNGV